MVSHTRTLVGGFALALCIALCTPSPVAAQEALIIDHTCCDLSQIPPYWIDQAKALTFHYAHTSHGSQVVDGALKLEQQDPFYSLAVRFSGTEGLPPMEDPPALRMYDGNPPETYIGPEDYWETPEGIARTQAVANTGNYDYSMWSWCGQVSWGSEEYISEYLAVMSQFEAQYPEMRFILMTGHTDGSGLEGTLHVRNNQIRQYAIDHGMVLFDFADIESWDPDGETWYLPLGCDDYGHYDGGDWPAEWCAAHPGDPRCESCSCAHSQSLICHLKGRAFWWMMARLAGWPGPYDSTGDLNCDGVVGLGDINPFALALSSPDGYAAAYPDCDITHADINDDGAVDFRDINPFVVLLAGGE